MNNMLSPTDKVDLTNCDREPIHILGHVQPFGCVLIMSRDFVVLSASDNAAGLLGLSHGEIVGAKIAIVEQLGARRVDIASNVRDALRSIEKNPPDFALLDINLGTENSVPVALKLRQLGVPFAFATGYGERTMPPPELGKVPIIQKPYMPEALVSAMPLQDTER